MATVESLAVFLRSIESKSYYGILRLRPDAPDADVKAAFHEFSLLYHPDRYVDSPVEASRTAGEIYKRGVEAYRCLSRRPERERYDRGLARGKLRMDASHPSTAPPPAELRTLEMCARSTDGKRLAMKADRLITAGRLEDARVQLVGACHCEPDNEELAERLKILWEALALEPP